MLTGMVAFVAVPYQLYQLTHSTLAVGLLGLADMIPTLALSILGGAIADALDRRRIALLAEAGGAVVAALLVVNASLASPQVWALYVLGAAGAGSYALGIPSLRALLPQLVGRDRIAAASALQSITLSIGAVAGPSLGGLLIAGVGLVGAYAVNLAGFAASTLAIWLLPTLPVLKAERLSVQGLRDGFRFVGRTRIVLAIFLVDSLAMVFGMPRALFPALATSTFGGGATTLGLLYAAPYAGALVAGLLSGPVGRVRSRGLWVAVFASLWGGAIAAFGLATTLWVALLLLAVAGAGDMVSAVLRSAIVLSETPDELRGRVTGIEFAQVASTPALGDLEAGAVAALTSVRFSIVFGGVACVASVAAVAVALPVLVRYTARRESLA